jgi:hypothetical protein
VHFIMLSIILSQSITAVRYSRSINYLYTLYTILNFNHSVFHSSSTEELLVMVISHLEGWEKRKRHVSNCHEST